MKPAPVPSTVAVQRLRGPAPSSPVVRLASVNVALPRAIGYLRTGQPVVSGIV